MEYRNIQADKPHPYPFEIDCLNCEDWTPAVNIFRLDEYHTEYFVCVFCGYETDGEHVIDVDEVDGYRRGYEAVKPEIDFYRQEGVNLLDELC